MADAPIARCNIQIDKQLLRLATDPAVMIGQDLVTTVGHFLTMNPDTESFGDLIITIKVTDKL